MKRWAVAIYDAGQDQLYLALVSGRNHREAVEEHFLFQDWQDDAEEEDKLVLPDALLGIQRLLLDHCDWRVEVEEIT